VVELVGWSFPQARVTTSPVAELLSSPLAPADNAVARIGVMHADLGATTGPYAPVSRHDLDAAGLDAWLLGHIHRPSLSAEDAVPCGYLGSLVGLDPTETGVHGPWRVYGDAGGVHVEQHALAPLRWERLDVAIEADTMSDDVGDRVFDEIERLARRIAEENPATPAPEALGVRVRLVGPTRQFDAIRRELDGGAWRKVTRVLGDTVVFIDKVEEALGLALDLAALARGNDPPALLARKLLALETDGDVRDGLLEKARSALRARAEAVTFAPLAERRDAGNPLSDEALTTMLSRSGTAALHSLLAQRNQGEGKGKGKGQSEEA